jgi:hypothetical protein
VAKSLSYSLGSDILRCHPGDGDSGRVEASKTVSGRAWLGQRSPDCLHIALLLLTRRLRSSLAQPGVPFRPVPAALPG